MPLAEKKTVNNPDEQWLQDGIIVPFDSEFSSPIVTLLLWKSAKGEQSYCKGSLSITIDRESTLECQNI